MTTETILIDRAHVGALLEQMQQEIGDAPDLPQLHVCQGRAAGALVVLASIGVLQQQEVILRFNQQSLAANARARDLFRILEAQTGLVFH